MILYVNLTINKYSVLKENEGKSGIYRWVNIITNESYVGSSADISKRLRKYYSTSYLKNKILKDNSLIYRAILKYNYSNFKLEILEYCAKESLLNREQYYMDLIKPEYNILKKAGSFLGFRHSVETKLKFKFREPSPGHTTKVVNTENNKGVEYKSIRAAAKGLGVSHTTLLRYIKINRLVKDIYLIIKSK